MKLKKNVLKIAFLSACLSFIFFYASVALILKQTITLQNIVAYLIFSFLIALIVGVFMNLEHKYGLMIFIISALIGFGSMIVSFMAELSGWNDLIGFLQMLIILASGLVLGTGVEIFLYYRDKLKKKRNEML